MHKLMKIVGCSLAAIGLACVVKHIMNCKECGCLSGCRKTKAEDEKPTSSTVSHKTKAEDEKPTSSTVSHKIKVEDEKTGSTVPHETKVEDEKRQGSRYGSNPIRY
ncbi:MAG TPA: hypothetical protein VN414_09915 [Methanosarcina sp.]|nr:hypothetical protein [Methanosarcina sp.]